MPVDQRLRRHSTSP